MSRRNEGPRLVYLKKRGCFYIRWSERGRSREQSTATKDLAEAEEFFAEFLEARKQGYRPRDPTRYPIADALAEYASEHAPYTAAPQRIGFAIDALSGFWCANTIADITRETCRAYQEYCGGSDGTVRRELTVLRAAINYAARRGRLTRAPFVWLPPKPAGKSRWLTRHEAAALLNVSRKDPRCRMHLPLFILIGLYTGARKEAILSLRWPQVDLVRGIINFNEPGRQQTSKGRAIVPIPRRLKWILLKAHKRGSPMEYVLHRDGQRVGDIKRSFVTARRRAGLKDVTPRTLRHSAGTWMAQRGVPLWEIGGFLGHNHERTTELYGHHHPDYLRKAREALD